MIPPPGRVVLLNGPSSSGKSSIGAALLPLLDDPWFLVPVDAVSGMRSTVHRRDLDAGRTAEMLRRTRTGYHRAVDALVRTGNDVIMDYPLSEPWRLADLLDVLDGVDVTLVHVRTDAAELARRELARGDRPVGLATQQRVYEHGLCDIEVDTTHQSPEQCAAFIVRRLETLAAPKAFDQLRAAARPAEPGRSCARLVDGPGGVWSRGFMTISWPLTDGRVTVRPATLDDAEAFLDYQRLPETQRYISRVIDTLDQARELVRERTDDPLGCLCAIELDSRLVGQIGGRVLVPESLGPEPRAQDFSLGYSVAPSHWGQGIASAAVRLFVAALHRDHGIRRVTAKVFAENQPSLRVLLKNGFRLEGTERAAVLGRDGRWLDDCTLSHFADD